MDTMTEIEKYAIFFKAHPDGCFLSDMSWYGHVDRFVEEPLTPSFGDDIGKPVHTIIKNNREQVGQCVMIMPYTDIKERFGIKTTRSKRNNIYTIVETPSGVTHYNEWFDEQHRTKQVKDRRHKLMVKTQEALRFGPVKVQGPVISDVIGEIWFPKPQRDWTNVPEATMEEMKERFDYIKEHFSDTCHKQKRESEAIRDVWIWFREQMRGAERTRIMHGWYGSVIYPEDEPKPKVPDYHASMVQRINDAWIGAVEYPHVKAPQIVAEPERHYEMRYDYAGRTTAKVIETTKGLVKVPRQKKSVEGRQKEFTFTTATFKGGKTHPGRDWFWDGTKADYQVVDKVDDSPKRFGGWYNPVVDGEWDVSIQHCHKYEAEMRGVNIPRDTPKWSEGSQQVATYDANDVVAEFSINRRRHGGPIQPMGHLVMDKKGKPKKVKGEDDKYEITYNIDPSDKPRPRTPIVEGSMLLEDVVNEYKDDILVHGWTYCGKPHKGNPSRQWPEHPWDFCSASVRPGSVMAKTGGNARDAKGLARTGIPQDNEDYEGWVGRQEGWVSRTGGWSEIHGVW